MTIRSASSRVLLLLLLCVCSAIHAQTCAPPLPFVHSFQNQGNASLQGSDPGVACALSASLNSGSGFVAAAVMHYRRSVPAASLRYSFRVDMSALVSTLSSTQDQVQIFSVNALTIAANPDFPVSQFLNVVLVGSSTGSPNLRLHAACSKNGLCTTNQSLTQNINVLRFEINVGATTAGNIRYWVNADFSDPPTGISDLNGTGLDNAALGGIIGAELGLSSPLTGFSQANTGAAIVFDQIQTSDDTLFWQNFEFDQQ